MKYIVMDETKTDIFTVEFDNLPDAINYADIAYGCLTNYDKKQRIAFYVLESVNPDEEAEDHHDGEILKQYI